MICYAIAVRISRSKVDETALVILGIFDVFVFMVLILMIGDILS